MLLRLSGASRKKEETIARRASSSQQRAQMACHTDAHSSAGMAVEQRCTGDQTHLCYALPRSVRSHSVLSFGRQSKNDVFWAQSGAREVQAKNLVFFFPFLFFSSSFLFFSPFGLISDRTGQHAVSSAHSRHAPAGTPALPAVYDVNQGWFPALHDSQKITHRLSKRCLPF